MDEDSASVYSASKEAREEFPELDLTIRGAISIGRKLQDPLAELVKIDPKSIGVKFYRHDVDQRRLSGKLEEVVGSVVNRCGGEPQHGLQVAPSTYVRNQRLSREEDRGPLRGRRKNSLPGSPQEGAREGGQDLSAVRGLSPRGEPLAAEKRAALDDILAELAKPNRDPRDEYPAPRECRGPTPQVSDTAEGEAEVERGVGRQKRKVGSRVESA